MRRWPKEFGKVLAEAFASPSNAGRGARPIAEAHLRVASFNATIDTKSADTSAEFSVPLKAGRHQLIANLLDQEGRSCAARFM